MAGVDGINGQSLYFAAAQAAAHQQAKETSKENKSTAIKKTNFTNSLEKAKEELELANDGLPVELAGKSPEEAFVFLKDNVDIAKDRLIESQSMENIENYKKNLKNFIRYMSRNNYEAIQKLRGFNRKTGKKVFFTEIQVIDQKLESLTYDLLYEHRKQIDLLARLEEINGLIVDLMAS